MLRPIRTAHLEGVSHLGWSLTVEEDRTPDGVFLTYRANRGAESIALDRSSYREFGANHFARLVEMAFPTRTALGSIAPLSPEDVDQLFDELAALTDVARLAPTKVAA